jgi:hypothetical protein
MCQPVGSHDGIIGLGRSDLNLVGHAGLQLISRIRIGHVSNLIAWRGRTGYAIELNLQEPVGKISYCVMFRRDGPIPRVFYPNYSSVLYCIVQCSGRHAFRTLF